MQSDEILISLNGLSRSFTEGGRKRKVIDGLNVEVRRGESVALLGRSGSGKSTLLNLISGIDLPDEGGVSIDGLSLTHLSEHERTLFRRRHIGFVYQFFNLIPTLTVEENLLLPLELNDHPPAKARKTAAGLLARIGLADRISTFPDRLSGGEQQRVAIARALAHEPLLVLADEPTGNLDAETGEHILDMLSGLVQQNGTTLIIVTHSRHVSAIANRTLTLCEGKLTEHAADNAW